MVCRLNPTQPLSGPYGVPQRRLHVAAQRSFDLGWSPCTLPAYLYSRPAACFKGCIPSSAPYTRPCQVFLRPHYHDHVPTAVAQGRSAHHLCYSESRSKERTLPGLKALRTAVPARAAAALAEATAALGERGCAAAFALRSSTGVVVACASAQPLQDA